MIVLRTSTELQEYRSSLQVSQKRDRQSTVPPNSWTPKSRGVGFVPTMGALHQGHLSLMKALRPHVDHLFVSIFVNPKQFGPNEDLSRYPRTLATDLELCQSAQVDAVFVPSVEDFYPSRFSLEVQETELSQVLCGAARPGHFKGVTTVLTKLFHLVAPDVSLFGLKDAQQFLIVRKLVEDLCFPLTVLGADTIREADGLALSSRNRYLSPELRATAPKIFHALTRLREAATAGQLTLDALEVEHRFLSEAGFQVQYLELRALPDLGAVRLPKGPHPLQKSKDPQGLESFSFGIFFAGILGSTRLIDNLLILRENDLSLTLSGVTPH
jgi:pantoate--beta-alanine ligase